MQSALGSEYLSDAACETESDGVLAEAAKRDPSAFSELYERYYPRVYRYVYHRIGQTAEAEDVTAHVFMKALEALDGYQTQRNSFAPWIFRIARNAVVDHYRRRRHQSSLEGLEQEAEGEDPAFSALAGERSRELHDLIQSLSPDQREVILLRYAADLTHAEIAEALKKNQAAVRMLLHRGLRRLKAVIGDEPL
jgi:RNA polymerase sigma-70 factor (ECF subfamily)